MKSKEELELMAEDSIVKDNYMNDMSDEEKYHHRRGFIIGYQLAESEFNNAALGNAMPSAYLVDLIGKHLVVLAENLADACDKLDKAGHKDYEFVRSSSINILH